MCNHWRKFQAIRDDTGEPIGWVGKPEERGQRFEWLGDDEMEVNATVSLLNAYGFAGSLADCHYVACHNCPVYITLRVSGSRQDGATCYLIFNTRTREIERYYVERAAAVARVVSLNTSLGRKK